MRSCLFLFLSIIVGDSLYTNRMIQESGNNLVFLVCCAYITWTKQFKLTMVCAIIGALIHCALLHSVQDLKAAQTNMQYNSLRIRWGTVWLQYSNQFKKFCSGYKNVDNHARSGGLKLWIQGHTPSRRSKSEE